MLSTSRLLFDGKQYSRLGKGAVERSMGLRVVRLITLARWSSEKGGGGPMRLLARKEVSPEGGAQVQEKQHGQRRQSANGALTRPVPRRNSYNKPHKESADYG